MALEYFTAPKLIKCLKKSEGLNLTAEYEKLHRTPGSSFLTSLFNFDLEFINFTQVINPNTQQMRAMKIKRNTTDIKSMNCKLMFNKYTNKIHLKLKCPGFSHRVTF